MIRRKTQDNIGYVIDTGGDDTPISWCPRCEKRGDKTRLGEKILLNNEPPASDHDQWLQCPKCYCLVPIFNVKYEGEIYSDLDTEDNPFDYSKADILGIDSRLKSRVKGVRRRQSSMKDQEIDGLVQDGWQVTSFSQTIPVDPNQ